MNKEWSGRSSDRPDLADAAYQGARGAFSEDAAFALLGPGASLLPCPTLEDVFAAVAAGRARSAVVPIENTLAGAVPGCADLIGRHDVHIVAERVQPIRHALIAPPGVTLAAVRRVLSHPVAIAQCEHFFRAHPEIAAVPVFDTAGAVDLVTSRGDTDAAAIAGRRAAEVYGGVVLADDIQDRADNLTRFLHLCPGAPPAGRHAGWKTTIVCVLKNEPGSLVRALSLLSSRGLNLTRIESRPTRETPFEYGFHLDIGGTSDLAALDGALDTLARESRSLRVLGHYPAAAGG
jgi:prephenate dehydratase